MRGTKPAAVATLFIENADKINNDGATGDQVAQSIRVMNIALIHAHRRQDPQMPVQRDIPAWQPDLVAFGAERRHQA